MSVVHTARFDTPDGVMLAASTDRGLLYLGLPHANGRGFQSFLGRFVLDAKIQSSYAPNRKVVMQVCDYLRGHRRDFDLRLDLRGTSFQKSVYRELQRIKYGETRSYGEIARSIGNPGGARAVGAANAANPLPLVIPCHRVIAAGKKLGGYAGGLPLKRRLLAMECVELGEGRLL